MKRCNSHLLDRWQGSVYSVCGMIEKDSQAILTQLTLATDRHASLRAHLTLTSQIVDPDRMPLNPRHQSLGLVCEELDTHHRLRIDQLP